MNTFIQFVNRKRELEFLENQTKKGSAFVVVYGRRRVGKSELLKHFIKGRKAVYLQATQEVEKELVESFCAQVAEYFDDAALRLNPFPKFSQLMEYLKEKDLGNLILVIDEFPYLVDANKAIPSILQKHWDNELRQKGLNVILCGSSIGAMETEVLGRKSPLYGRRTGQWKVDPLLFKDFLKFFPRLKFEEAIRFYAITGGIPLYVIEFDKKTVYENAKSAIATRGALLYQEVSIILKEELREPKTYFSLLKEIAAGKTAINELATSLGVERTALTRYLDTLIELDLVEAVKPFSSKEKSKKTQYLLKDNYFKFWFRFIYPFKKDLDSFIFDGFEAHFRNNFNSFMGRQFEHVCSQALRLDNPIKSGRLGRWWGAYREGGERKTAEFDIVSFNNETREVLFAECKWKENVDAGAVLKDLEKRAAIVDWNQGKRKDHFAVYARSFRTKKGLGKNVFLYDLKDLERMFRK